MRVEALEALPRVRDQLGLGVDRAPTKEAFNREAKRLGLEWSGARVIDWWGRWRFAAAEALTGGQAPLTAAQKSLRRAVSGREQTSEESLTALRAWLATGARSTTASDYDEWVREHNGALSADELLMPSAATIRLPLAATWRDLVRVGKGELCARAGPADQTARWIRRGGAVRLRLGAEDHRDPGRDSPSRTLGDQRGGVPPGRRPARPSAPLAAE